jgi:hypothetical protein
MRNKLRVMISLAVMLFSFAAHAQDQPKGAGETPPTEVPAAAPEERLSINGYLNIEGDYQLTQQGLGDRKGSIDVDVFELLVNYKGSDKLRVSAAVDFEHGVDTEFAQGELTTGWMFIEYAHADALKLRVGKFLTPFGVYNEIHGAKNLFLSRDEPRATLKPQKSAKNGFRYAPKWMTGGLATGTLPAGKGSFDYIVAFGNGEQLETNPYEVDNNTKKATLARVQYMPNDAITLGVSGYHDFLTLKTTSDEGNVTSLGAHARYDGSNWKLLYELAHGRQRLPGAPVTASETGHVAEAGYRFASGLTPFVQWQTVDTKAGAVKENATAVAAGIDIPIGRHFVYKVQAMYWTGSKDNKKFNFEGRRYSEISMAFFYGF